MKRFLCKAVLVAAVTPGSVFAAETINGQNLNGTEKQGVSVNGQDPQGVAFNGNVDQGVVVNGNVNQGVAVNGGVNQGVAVNGNVNQGVAINGKPGALNSTASAKPPTDPMTTGVKIPGAVASHGRLFVR